MTVAKRWMVVLGALLVAATVGRSILEGG